MSGTTSTIVIYLYTGFTHIHRVKPTILFVITYMILFMRETFLLVQKEVKPQIFYGSQKFSHNFLEKVILN